MANTIKSLIEKILKEADHNIAADTDINISCDCERCFTGKFFEKFFRLQGLVLVPTSKHTTMKPLYALNQCSTAIRHRRHIQNDENKYKSCKQTRKLRRKLEKKLVKEAIERKPEEDQEELTYKEKREYKINSKPEPQKPSSLTRTKYKSVGD